MNTLILCQVPSTIVQLTVHLGFELGVQGSRHFKILQKKVPQNKEMKTFF